VNNPVGIYNFIVPQGSDFSLQINLKDADGDPIDLTGYAARMQLRVTPDASAAILSLTNINGGINLNSPDTGSLKLNFSAAITTPLVANEYDYDLELVDGASKVTRILQGSVNITREVTR